jgi:hypothetical protein
LGVGQASKLPGASVRTQISVREHSREWNFVGMGADSGSVDPSGHSGNAILQFWGGETGEAGRCVGRGGGRVRRPEWYNGCIDAWLKIARSKHSSSNYTN